MIEKSEKKSPHVIQSIRNFISSLQKKVNFFIECLRDDSFYHKYRNTSLAILNEFESKKQAITTATKYEIPLMRIVITSNEEQEYTWKYFINCFENAQILNHSFILWIHFRFQVDQQRVSKVREGILECYNKDRVYSSYKLKGLPRDQEMIEDFLNRLRSQYYILEEEDENLMEKFRKTVDRKQRNKEPILDIKESNKNEMKQQEKQLLQSDEKMEGISYIIPKQKTIKKMANQNKQTKEKRKRLKKYYSIKRKNQKFQQSIKNN